MPKKRTDDQIAHDRKRIADLTLRHWRQIDIAAELGISQPTVARDLEAIKADWQSKMLSEITAYKAIELARLNALEAEAWRAWEESRKGGERHQQWAGVATSGPATKLKAQRYQVTKRNCHGNPRYMAQILKISDRRCRLLGLNLPLKAAPLLSSANDPALMTMDERVERALAILRRVAGLQPPASDETPSDADASCRNPTTP